MTKMSLSRRGRGYSEYKVTGMYKGFFGFEIFDSGIFLGKKTLVIFWMA